MFSEAQYTNTKILNYSYFVDQEPARGEEKSSSYPSRDYKENGIDYCTTTTENGVYWYTYVMNNPLLLPTPPDIGSRHSLKLHNFESLKKKYL